MPIRIYYQVTRWIFGNEYNPYETNVKEGLHPIIDFLMKHDTKILLSYSIFQNILSTVIIIYILRFSTKLLYK